MTKRTRQTTKKPAVKADVAVPSSAAVVRDPDSSPPPTKSVAPRPTSLVAGKVNTHRQVTAILKGLLPATRAEQAMAAVVPWLCDSVPSTNGRRSYLAELATFAAYLQQQGIHPLDATGDDVRLYKEALQQADQSNSTIAHALSVLRGTYQQFGTQGLVPWDTVRDIQAVKAPRVDKNTTPSLTEEEAKRLLHAPDRQTLIGKRDHALLFTYFKTACRCSAVIAARVGDLIQHDHEYYLLVTEKGKKKQRKPLLDATPAIFAWLDAAGIREDPRGPLFRPIAKDRLTVLPTALNRTTTWRIIKKYGRAVGIDVDRLDGRGVGVHTLRKTALTNALEHGAKMEQVQQWAGHADIRTTQGYYTPKDRDADEAARHNQIR